METSVLSVNCRRDKMQLHPTDSLGFSDLIFPFIQVQGRLIQIHQCDMKNASALQYETTGVS